MIDAAAMGICRLFEADERLAECFRPEAAACVDALIEAGAIQTTTTGE